jgi:predicted KAP-like P-loop ATPase
MERAKELNMLPKIFNDTPPRKDDLGFEALVTVLLQVIQSVQPPFTIGIFSKWGFGKTTLMTMVQQKIKAESKLKTVWFNPWKYNENELIWKALITELYSEIARDDKITVEFLRRAMEKVTNFTGGFAGKNEIGTKFFDLFRLEPQFLNQMEDFTNKLINEFVGKDGKLVIFIDDLDRCLPENAIKVLEAIKLFFDDSRCIFMIGLDKSVIERGIHTIYDEKIGMSGIDYLEKIIQLPFNVPAVADENIGRFILTLCDESTKNVIWEVLKYGSDNNPRRIKRFFNIFNILKQISHFETHDEERVLAKVIMLQLRFPTFYEFLIESPSYLNSLDAVTGMLPEKRQSYLANDQKLKEFFDNRKLRQFISNTSKIACTDSELMKYLRLTNTVSMTEVIKED